MAPSSLIALHFVREDGPRDMLPELNVKCGEIKVVYLFLYQQHQFRAQDYFAGSVRTETLE